MQIWSAMTSVVTLLGWWCLLGYLAWLTRSQGWRWVATAIGPVAGFVLVTTVAAVYAARLVWQRHRRWGSVPRVLVVGDERIDLNWLGWRNTMRRRSWATADVTGVRWQPVRDVFRRRTIVVRVSVRSHAGRPLRFALRSTDGAVVERARVAVVDGLGPTSERS